MDSITLTISLKDLDACDGDFDQLVDDIQAFINILHHASPDYVEAGNILQKQLDEQVNKHKEETDPREKFLKKLDDYRPIVIDGSDPNLSSLYRDLCNSIGGAPRLVVYAAFKLVQYLEEQNFASGTRWVWDFVNYYEENYHGEN